MTDQKNDRKFFGLIKKLKVDRVSLFCLVLGGVFLYLPNLEFVKGLLPLGDWLKLLGQALIVGGIITATYEYIVRKETYSEMAQEIENQIGISMAQESEKLKKNMPLYVTRALMADREVQKEILGSTKINEIISTCLSSKLGEDMTKDLFEGVIQPVLNGFERTAQRVMYNYNIYVQLEENENSDIKDAFYTLEMSIDYKYEIKIPQLKFACLTSEKDFNIYLRDSTYTYTYYLPVPTLSGTMFDVLVAKILCQGKTLNLEKKVDEEGASLKKIRFDHPDFAKYTGKTSKLIYRIRTLIRKDGHMFFIRTKHPIRDFRAIFDTGNTDITGVYVSDQFVSSGSSTVEDGGSGRKILKIVSVDGWIFPNSGVTFVWRY